MITFKATTEQILDMASLAVNASKPMGFGHLHYTDKEFTSEDFSLTKGELSLDYFQGRMVKLYFSKKEDGSWYSNSFPPSSDYQSWATKYPNSSLIEICGGEVAT